jgi:hypothetical protein
MASRKHFNVRLKAILGDASLELEGKEAVVRRGDYTDRYLRPALKTAGFPEDRFCLFTRT